MKANKVTVDIKIEVLSIDSIHGLLQEVSDQIKKEAESGKLSMNDGDSIRWNTERKLMEF